MPETELVKVADSFGGALWERRAVKPKPKSKPKSKSKSTSSKSKGDDE